MEPGIADQRPARSIGLAEEIRQVGGAEKSLGASGVTGSLRQARREVQRGPSSIPGREIVQVVTEIPAGIESGWHVHPGEEVGYIVVGEVEMMVQGRANVILRAAVASQPG